MSNHCEVSVDRVESLPAPPGPGRMSGMGDLLKLISGDMGHFTALHKKWGDTFRLKTPQGDDVVMVFHPDDVNTVLKKNAKGYPKGDRYHELIPVLGMGLVNSDGDLWRRQRKVVQKPFCNKGTLQFMPVIQRHSQALLKKWFDLGPQFERDINRDMLVTTFGIAGDAFFGAGIEHHAESIQRNFKFALSNAQRRMFAPVKLPLSFPTPRHIRFRRAMAAIDNIIYGIIDDFIARENVGDECVLASMISALRADGETLDRQQLRDEVCTILMVGHETSSVSLCWLLYLLAKHPQVQDRVFQELVDQPWEEIPSLENVQSANYLSAVLKESLRVYPSVPFVLRQAAHDGELGGYQVKQGSTILVSPWVTHRHQSYWPQADTFTPETWLDTDEKSMHPGAYIPFGFGARICMGKFMAQLELKMIVADIVKNYQISLSPEFTPVPRGYISLQPDTGMTLRFERRR